MIALEPEVKQLTERNVAFVSFTGNFIGNAEVFNNLFQKLCRWAGPKGFLAGIPSFSAAYQNDVDKISAEEMTVEVCLEVPEGTEPDTGIDIKRVPGGTYVCMNVELTGTEEYKEAWKKALDWVQANKYEVDLSRPSYELYLNNPEEHPQKHHLLDICISIL